MSNYLTHQLKNQRGMTLAFTAMAMAAFVAFAVVGIDLARLAFTATEVQTLADVAATAGARALFSGASVVGQAQTVAGQNQVDGSPGEIAPPGTIEQGHYDFDASTFTVGGTPANAVRANAEATVNNFVAVIAISGLFGQPTTTVRKTAIAAFGPPQLGTPTLPLAFDECHFPDPDCASQSCLPQLFTVPSTTDNSGWTGFLEGSGQTDILRYFPSPCGGGLSQTISVGDNISLNNGDITPLFNAVQCMICTLGISEFLIPIIRDGSPDSCDDNFNQTGSVSGFATIRVDTFIRANGSSTTPICANNPAIKGLQLSAMFRTDGGGPPGDGDSTGLFVVKMVH